MKLSIGEFPEDHHLILVARPFVEWSFKVIGWLILTATIKFAHQKTGNQFLFYLMLFCYVLLLAFVGGLVDWVLSFRRYKTISGKKLLAAASLEIQPTKIAWKEKLLANLKKGTRLTITIVATIVLIGASNIATDKIIEAFIEFQMTK